MALLKCSVYLRLKKNQAIFLVLKSIVLGI